MPRLNGKQRTYLRGLAHELRPLVHIGAQGLSPEFLRQLDEALEHHELVKVKFLQCRDAKDEMIATMASELDCAVVGTIGHNVVLYRPNRIPERRRIRLPVALAAAWG